MNEGEEHYIYIYIMYQKRENVLSFSNLFTTNVTWSLPVSDKILSQSVT